MSTPGGVWGCALHARLGSTCCQGSEILLTAGDQRRLSAAAGRDDLWERRPPADPSAADFSEDPTWALGFFPDGSRPVLRHGAGVDCALLGPTGCTLSLAQRPLICRLFPFEYTEAGLSGLSSRCPSQVVPDGLTLEAVLDLDPDQAEAWRAQLYAELREEPRR